MVSRFFSCFLFILFSVSSLYSQTPIVQSISPKSTTIDEIVEITGNNFGTSASNIKVYFGAAQGMVVKVENNLILAKVPAGATYDNIAVINSASGLSAYSKDNFLLSFGGQGVVASNLLSQVDFPGDLGLYDHCVGDFDLDGKVDVAMANYQTNSVTVIKNTSSLTAISFDAKENFNLGAPASNIISNDIDGDGKLDLIISKYPTGTAVADKIFILKNISQTASGSEDIIFDNYIELSVDGNNARNIVVEDLDGDGKPEVIVSNEANNIITILRNQSTIGNISFNSTPVKVTLSGVSKCSGLTTADLNGDSKSELIVTTYLGSNIYVVPNFSAPGSIDFGATKTISISENIINVIAGDLNGDNKPDLVVTKVSSGNISVVVNKTLEPGGEISFNASKDFITAPQPWGIDIGDIDGDGRPDLAIASVYSDKLFTILRNTTINGELSFASKIDLTTTEPSRSVKIVDINGDGKPDLTFSSINSAKLSVIRNKHCVVAKVSPQGPLTLCPGQSITLNAPKGRGLTYQWKKNSVDISSATSSSLVVSYADVGDYKVIVNGEGTSCSYASNSVTIGAGTGSIPSVALASNSGPVCQGESVTLMGSSVVGATYSWKGPNGFASTEQNPVIDKVDYSKAGSYLLKISVGSCSSDYDTTIVILNTSSPTANIIAPSTIICGNENVQLKVSEAVGYTFQWKKDGSPISGATSATYMATEAGNYSIEVSVDGGCTVTSKDFAVTKPEVVTPDFSMSSTGCANTFVALVNNTQLTNSSLNVKYLWDFGNGTTTSEKDPSIKRPKYIAAGTYKVKLRVTVNDKCVSEVEKSIVISDNFNVEIKSSNPAKKFCEGEGVTLSGPEGYATYKWKKGTEVIAESTLPSIIVNESGTYALELSQDGCNGSGVITLDMAPKPVVIAHVVGESSVVTPGDSLELRAEGAENYVWAPSEGLSNDSIANPKVLPSGNTTYTVIGRNSEGCTDTATVNVSVSNEVLVTAMNVFTPNGDDKNQTWVIDNIDNYKNCKVIILNRQGQKVFEAMPYNNDWDGTWNGKEQPEGTYYYIIQCKESGEGKTGSLTLVR